MFDRFNIEKIKSIFVRTILWILGVFAISLFFTIIFGDTEGLSRTEKSAAGLAFIAIVAAFLFAWRQDGMSRRTHELTQKLNTDRLRIKRVEGFFGIRYFDRSTMECILPVVEGDLRKPLPLVNGGDFFAANVLSRLLGDRVRLEPCLKSDGVNDEKMLSWKQVERRAGRQKASPIVLVCSPEANAYVGELVPTINVDRSGWNMPQNLPIWFARSEHWKYLKLVEVNKRLQHNSEADEVYERCEKEEGYQPTGRVRDSGLIARLKVNGRVFVIIAGIHQYGTWIAGDALFRLLQFGPDETKTPAEDAESCFSDDEIVLMYHGEFDHDTWSVVGSSMEFDKGWRRRTGDDEWRRLGKVSVRHMDAGKITTTW